MRLRSQGGRFGLWLVILALCGMFLHAPAMAAMESAAGPGAGAASIHLAGQAAHGATPDMTAEHLHGISCCILCGPGACCAGPAADKLLVVLDPVALGAGWRGGDAHAPLAAARDWYWSRGPPRSV